jgi:CubicO group peptidase (beta-lactamase class C family)
MKPVDLQYNSSVQISGYCHEDFQEVAEIFAQNFDQYNEIGSSLCVVVDGETAVDIWGGYTNEQRTDEWNNETLSVAFSSTKAALALCAHILIEREELKTEDKVVKYWPEYGKKGKVETTVGMILNHTAGLPAFATTVEQGGFFDWEYMIGLLENEAPFWIPGRKTGYHMMTTGWLIGELIKRVTGKSLGEFFNDEVSKPYNLEYWIGLPDSEVGRVAKVTPFKSSPSDKPSEFADAFRLKPNSMQRLSLTNTGGYDYNSVDTYKAEIGGVGGIANARSLAGMLTPLAQNDEKLLSKKTVKRLSQSYSVPGKDSMLMLPTRFSEGLMIHMDNRDNFQGEGGSFIIGPNAFGHVGFGGSSATFADPDYKMSFGYMVNKLGGEYLISERCQNLINASYTSLHT